MRRVSVLAAVAAATAMTTPASAATGFNTGYAGLAVTGAQNAAGQLRASCGFAYRMVTLDGSSVEIAGAAVTTAASVTTSVHCEVRSPSGQVYGTANGSGPGPVAVAAESTFFPGIPRLTICVSATGGGMNAPLVCSTPAPLP